MHLYVYSVNIVKCTYTGVHMSRDKLIQKHAGSQKKMNAVMLQKKKQQNSAIQAVLIARL